MRTVIRTLRNYHRPMLRVKYSDLRRYMDGKFASICPTCDEGLLLVRRDEKTFKLMRYDHCTLCAQQVYYTDNEVNGEEFSTEVKND